MIIADSRVIFFSFKDYSGPFLLMYLHFEDK